MRTPGVLRWFRTKRELIEEIKLLERVYRRACEEQGCRPIQ